jgi:hypothetical protein
VVPVWDNVFHSNLKYLPKNMFGIFGTENHRFMVPKIPNML